LYEKIVDALSVIRGDYFVWLNITIFMVEVPKNYCGLGMAKRQVVSRKYLIE